MAKPLVKTKYSMLLSAVLCSLDFITVSPFHFFHFSDPTFSMVSIHNPLTTKLYKSNNENA